MISYEEAIRIIDGRSHVLASHRRSLSQASGFVLGEDLVALCDSPPFDNSAVDGYGRRVEDLNSVELKLRGEVRAGDDGLIEVREGQTVRIFTGAPVPEGVAAIAMQEDCERVDDLVRFLDPSHNGDHIRRARSDFKCGDLLLKKGTLLSPPSLGLAASGGHDLVDAISRPRVSIVTTGDELVEPGEKLEPGQIYNSNVVALVAATLPFADSARSWHREDDLESLKFILPAIIQDSDIVITCGGVSVGDYDFLKEAFTSSGVEEAFWQVAIKPGKPVYFGTKGKTLVFGLPGNPVSALVTFALFVQPALLRMSGHADPWPKSIPARFEGHATKKPGRMEFLRGNSSADGSVREAGEQGSHQIAALAAANCLIQFPLEATELRSGDEVAVLPLRWGPGA